MHKYLILILLWYGCNDPTSSSIPEELPDDYVNSYSPNLSSINSGTHVEYVTLNWNQYNYNDFVSYTIVNENDENIVTLYESNASSYNVNLSSGSFEKIYLNIETELTSLKDSIEIFTRPIKSITDFNAIAIVEDWSTALSWTATNELDSIFKNYTIYRMDTLNYSLFNNLSNCNCDVTSIDDQTTSSYVDNDNFDLGEEYFYIIETNTIQDYGRKSIIRSNIDNSYSLTPMIHDSPSASQEEYNKIILNWTHNLNEEEFYEIQLWRSDSEDINPLNDTQLAIIIDHHKNYFEDSYNIGNGATWFYKIKLIDVHGNYSVSDIIIGNSHP